MIPALLLLALGDLQFSDAGNILRLNCGPNVTCTRTGSTGLLSAVIPAVDGGSNTNAAGWFNDGGSTAANTLRVAIGAGGVSTDGGVAVYGDPANGIGINIVGAHSSRAIMMDNGERIGWRGGNYIGSTGTGATSALTLSVNGTAVLLCDANIGNCVFNAFTPVSILSSLSVAGTASASNLSGTNTGDVTIGTGNGLSLAGQAISDACAGAGQSGALCNSAGVLAVDAGLVAMKSLDVGPLGIATDGGVRTDTIQALSNQMASIAMNGNGNELRLVYDGTADGGLQCKLGVNNATVAVNSNCPFTANNTSNGGLVVLSGGTGTATIAGATHCTCSLDTSAGTLAPKCHLAAGTLTVTGSGTDTIAYTCH